MTVEFIAQRVMLNRRIWCVAGLRPEGENPLCSADSGTHSRVHCVNDITAMFSALGPSSYFDGLGDACEVCVDQA